jgi:dTDP-4-amino-4,6-dideoxygalactose transaminase
MIPLFKVAMSTENACDAVNKVLASGYIGQGPVVDEFEKELQKELGTKLTPITVNSCTSAIDLSLRLIGVEPGDTVISSPMSCFASSSPILAQHANILWADIDPLTGLMDPKSVEKLITPEVKAIVAVNWAGRLCDYAALKSFGVPVIEDAAHTWDTFWDEATRASTERGDFICYSLQAIKFLTSGDGGLIVTDNEEWHEKAILTRWYGLDRTKSESFRCTQSIKYPGHKYHMNDISASIGLSNIQYANLNVLSHRENAKVLCDGISNPNLTVPPFDPTCSYWLFSVLVEKGTKEDFVSYLKDNGIAASPVHHRNDFFECTQPFANPNLPGVDNFAGKQVSIPVGWWLSTTSLEYIINVCNNY